MCVITRIIAQLRPHYERELNTLTEFLHVVDKNRLQPRTVYARYEQRTLKLSYQAAQTHQPLSLDLIAGPDAPALELNFAIPPAANAGLRQQDTCPHFRLHQPALQGRLRRHFGTALGEHLLALCGDALFLNKKIKRPYTMQGRFCNDLETGLILIALRALRPLGFGP